MLGDELDGVDGARTPAGGSEQDTFVVRVWMSGPPGAVRGHVQHVRSRRSVYFANRQRLQTFIEEQVRIAGARGST